MMKKLVSMLLMLSVMLVLTTHTGQAAAVPKLYLNGNTLASDVEPRLVNNNTMVPIAVIASGMGYQVGWDQNTKSASIHSGQTEMVLTVGKATALVNGQQVRLDAPPLIEKGRTMLPLRFVGSQFGLDVQWDNVAKSVHMNDKQPSLPGNPGVPPGAGPSPDLPPDSGYIQAISYDGVSRFSISYDGVIAPNAMMVLTGPDRLVLDLPNTSFGSRFEPGTPSGEASFEVDGHPALSGIRYSAHADKPLRIVFDLAVPTSYELSQSDGMLNIDVKYPEPGAVPSPGTDSEGNKIYKVVIDAGHGGRDPGAISITKRQEKEFNLSVALKIKALLDKEPRIQPYMTRSDDTFVELADRAKFANDLKADLFLSIHANSFRPEVTGTETYYNRQSSRAFADVMHKHLVKATGLPDRKVRQANFAVIRQTTMPAILIEAGYLSNRHDDSVLAKNEVRDRIAQEMVAGIKSYLKLS
ncbi:N-acetylmuramoyl-L-alanine amidase [Paenibacillus sp. 1P07SE]|uniref:N-acetylmuramoyl-L-alanine amidase n=1 Tax=Paenibacillus sp. 1P07SE TaxID=3132209 RepID=UPI0039A729E7